MKELILNEFNSEEVILDVFNTECKLFMKTNSYQLIEQKCENKCLSPNEIQQLNLDVRNSFTLLIKTITRICSNLTDEDITFCCLTKSGLNKLIICHCMGDVSKQPINQRKYRIKKKMEEAQCIFLFNLIFPSFIF